MPCTRKKTSRKDPVSERTLYLGAPKAHGHTSPGQRPISAKISHPDQEPTVNIGWCRSIPRRSLPHRGRSNPLVYEPKERSFRTAQHSSQLSTTRSESKSASNAAQRVTRPVHNNGIDTSLALRRNIGHQPPVDVELPSLYSVCVNLGSDGRRGLK
jgi:hypothetical protein